MSKEDDQARLGAALTGGSLATDDTIDIDLDALPLPPAAERAPLDGDRSSATAGTGPTDTGDLAPPPLIAGRYAPLSMVGRGATGRVYRVHDQQLDEVIALKLVREELLDDDAVGERFRHEVKLARRVTHPNVARTFDIGEHNGQPFTTMEFIDGPVLTDVIAREAPLTPRRVARIGRMLCAGLGAAHAAGIVHRDLKPDNILLRSTGEAVITDFGIARAFLGDGEQTGRAFLGTPAYMAPEQVEGMGLVDGRADIYALGLIFYELLTGEPVWSGPSPIAVATARLDDDPPDPAAIPDLGWPLVDLLRRCMSRDPDARPSSVQEIDEILAGLTSVTRPMAAVKPSARSGARLLPTISRPMALLAERRETVAVMPFASDGLDAYLVDGLADDIVDVLSMTPGLQVRPLTASRRLPTRDPLEAGRTLGVAMVVTGQVSRRGDGLRIRAAVLSVEDGFQLWGGRFACAAHEMPTIADVIAVAVAEALTVSPRPETTHLAMPADGRATDAFLRGRRHLRRLWHQDVQGAIDVLDEGLQWAPDDIRLLSAGAVARARLAFLGSSPREAAALVEAAAMAARARQIAPDRPEPYHAGAMVYFCQGCAAQAVPLLVKAMERAPGDFWIRDLMGRVLLEIGPIGAARKHLEAALALDGQAYNTRWDLARAHAFVNDWLGVDALLALPVDGRADAWVRSGVRSRLDVWRADPRWVNEPLPEGSSGGVMEPIIRLLRATSVEGPAAHHGQQMRRYAEQARQVAPRRALLLYQFAAESAARIRDHTAVMANLADAEAHGLSDVVWLQRCPVLRPYAGDPGLQALKARVARRAGQIPTPGTA